MLPDFTIIAVKSRITMLKQYKKISFNINEFSVRYMYIYLRYMVTKIRLDDPTYEFPNKFGMILHKYRWLMLFLNSDIRFIIYFPHWE